MSKLYNYTLYFSGKATYTAEDYDEAVNKLIAKHGNVEVDDCDWESFDGEVDDYMD